MDENLYWCVEFTSEDGDSSGHVFTDPEKLGQFVKVNARDMGQIRIAVVSENVLASDKVAEVFG